MNINKRFGLNKTIVLLFFIYFMQGVIHNLGHPVTPKLVEDFGISDYYFGLYFASMSLGLLLGSPLWGYLGDHKDKRLFIGVGLVLYSFGQYMFAYIGNENWMILFRFLSGFFVSASITLLMSHLLEHTKLAQRKVILGWYQAMFLIGTSLGYYLGGVLPTLSLYQMYFLADDLRGVFFIQAFLNLFHALFIVVFIGKTKRVSKQNVRSNPLTAILQITRLDSNLLLFLISLTLISLGSINVSKFIEVYMNQKGLLASDIGQFVGITGIVSLITMIVLVPFVARAKRDFTLMVIIQSLSAVIILLVFHGEDLMMMLYSIFLVYVVLKTLYTPLEQHFISSFAKEGEYGLIMGVRQSFYSIGMVVGPLIGGFLLERNATLVFDFSALMFILGCLMLLVIGRNIKQKTMDTE
jgi:DHA1 family multidrug resistance protein-like MFS transporter